MTPDPLPEDRLDALFAADRVPPASAAVKAAITDAALARIRSLPPRGVDWRFLFSFKVEMAFAAAVAAGLFAGFVLGPALDPPQRHGVPALALLLGGDEFEEPL